MELQEHKEETEKSYEEFSNLLNEFGHNTIKLHTLFGKTTIARTNPRGTAEYIKVFIEDPDTGRLDQFTIKEGRVVDRGGPRNITPEMVLENLPKDDRGSRKQKEAA